MVVASEQIVNLKQHLVFLGCDDLEKVRDFYSEVIELPLVADEGRTLVYQLDDTQLRISHIDDFHPQSFTVLGWMVDNIEVTIKKLTARGVEFLRYPQFQQDDLGVWTMGGVKIAWFLDPAGNNLSLTQI